MAQKIHLETSEISNFLLQANTRGEENRKRLTRLVSKLAAYDSRNQTILGLQDIFEILAKVIKDIEWELRQELAKVLSKHEKCPPSLIRYLSNDNIDIALPTVITSTLIKESNLLEIVEQRAQEYRLMITQQATLPQTVMANNTHMDRSPLNLDQNISIQLKHQITAYRLEESQRHDSSHKPVLHRSELGRDLALQLTAYISAAIQQSISKKFQINVETIQDSVRSVENNFNSNLLDVLQGWGKAHDLVKTMYRQQHLNINTLPQLLKFGEVSLFIASLEYFSRLPRLLTRRFIFEEQAEGLCITCRALNMTADDFKSLYALLKHARLKKHKDTTKEDIRIQHLFESISMDKANTILKYWQTDSTFLATRHAALNTVPEPPEN